MTRQRTGMRGRPKAQLVLSEAEREQLTALTLRRQDGAGACTACAHRAGLRRTGDQQRGGGASARHQANGLRVASTLCRAPGDGPLDVPAPGAPRIIDDAREDAVIARRTSNS